MLLGPEMSHVEKDRAIFPEEYLWKPAAGMGEEIEWSAAEMGNPPPEWVAEVVVRKLRGRRVKVINAHSQVLRVRAEDSHLGEDRVGVAQFMVFSRPLLPASPLSGKAASLLNGFRNQHLDEVQRAGEFGGSGIKHLFSCS